MIDVEIDMIVSDSMKALAQIKLKTNQ